MPKLTVGMAVYEDYDGVVFTLQSLRLGNDLRDVELIVVDNSPNTPSGRDTANAVANFRHGTAGVKYVPMLENTGTTQPRNRVFAEATGDAVLCMDSHVLLRPGTIDRLIKWYDDHPDCKDLLSGPLLYDGLDQISTQFDNVWRGEMWGVWGGDPRGDDENGEPFEIWAQGLGLFTCRRDAWLGFNPHFRGFGGEEGYIHEKYRQAGRKNLCLPWLRWWHRFGRPGGVKYPLTRWNKIRNYVLGHAELGLSLDPIYEHFVKPGLMPQKEWDWLIADPVGHADGRQMFMANQVPLSLDDLFTAYKSKPRDLDQHADTLKLLASDVGHVTLFVKRREWLPFVASGRPATIIAHCSEDDGGVSRALASQNAAESRRIESFNFDAADSLSIQSIDPTEFLILDTVHSEKRLAEELRRFAPQVSRRILVRSTAAFGQLAEDGSGPGMWPAMQEFVAKHPEWFVMLHRNEQWGMTILSKDERDRPPQPIVPWPPTSGPGTELSRLLADIGIHPTANCGCKALALDMDRAGVEGCRNNVDRLAEAITANQEGWGWKDKMTAAFKAASHGYFSIKSLVEEAIRRAEAKETQGKVAA